MNFLNRCLVCAVLIIPASAGFAAPSMIGVRNALQTAIDTAEVAGAVAIVVTKDSIQDAEAAGYADLATRSQMRTDTIFWIASMTKPVTGVAVLMLQDDGKLNVTDLVEKYIPAFAELKTPSGQPARITIKQLLTHTSGLGEAPVAAALHAHTLAELTPLILAAPMQSEPGSRWKYCQAGINTAARIVEIASGMPYDVFVHRRILDPLGMKDTTFRRTPAVMARLATAYAKSKTTGELQPIPPRADFGLANQPPYGNAGLYSTGPDYARFCQMLLGGGVFRGRRYLSPAAYKLLTTVQTGTLETGFLQSARDGARGANYGWGIGTAIQRSSHDGVGAMLSPGTFGHGGAWGTQAWIDPVKGRAYILMVQRSNFTNGDNSEIRRAFQAAAAASPLVSEVATEAPAADSRSFADALQPFIDHKLMPGAVGLVENREGVIDTEAVGLADVAGQKPMRPDSLFWIASMSKPIAGTAVMMLVEEGKIRVDDPVEHYLPEFKGQMYVTDHDDTHALLKSPRRPMLIRDLLTHTSGLPPSGPLGVPADSLPLAANVRSYALAPLQHEPGTHYAYSSPGINTAGRIVEVVSGMPYEKFLAARLFEPLGMTETTFFPTAAQLARLAKSYKTGWIEGSLNSLSARLDDPDRHAEPAGGLFSTAADMAKFCRMILNGGELDGRRYLQATTVAMMTRKETPEQMRNGYGFGWTTNIGKDEAAFGHTGAYCTFMFIDPKVGLAAVFLVQHDRGWTGPEEKTVWKTFMRAAYERAVPGSTAGAELIAH